MTTSTGRPARRPPASPRRSRISFSAVGGTVGNGDDTFVSAKITDSTTSAPDLISEYHTGDLIDLHLIDANPGLPGRQSFHFESANTDGGDVRVHYDAAQNVTHAELYLHGATTPDALIRMAGHQTLTAADFIF